MRQILLIEDAADLADWVQRELTKEGFQVETAGNGKKALKLFSSVNPDLIILDWMLPEMDGLEVLRRIRMISSLPVLMLTARSDETDRVVGLELGADDYMVKPFGMRELVARVHALLRRLDHIQEMISSDRLTITNRITYGTLEMNPETMEILNGGQPVELSHTEFDMLHLFIRHPGRVFSRAYLSETVWNQTYLDGDRSIDNAVLRLRRKIGKPGKDIETVWGIGYRLKKK